MQKYKCDICGKKHNVYRGVESPLPEIINDIPEEKKATRIREINGFYFVDKKYLLVDDYIQIKLESLEEPFFNWKVWTSISTEDFQTNLEKLKSGEVVEFNGLLESELPFYPKSKGLKSKVIFQYSVELDIDIRIEEESRLKTDQSKPISKDRVIELMQHLHHPELFKEKTVFEKSFSERLKEELIYAKREFINKNKNFAINISSPNSTLFQIINNKMLESKETEESGFGLHLSFDESFDESKEEIEKFRKQEYSNDFIFHNLDDIPTYQIDLGNDIERIENLVKNLIVDVYEQNIETIEIDNFEI